MFWMTLRKSHKAQKAPTCWSMPFGWGIGIFIASLALVATRQTLHRRVCSLNANPLRCSNPSNKHHHKKRKAPTCWSMPFGWGIGIRTPTNRVRVCRATVTLFPIAKSIIYVSTANVNTFFRFFCSYF